MAVQHISPDLPSIYHVPGNPFEDYGVMHNRIINLVISCGNVDSALTKIINYDSLFYNQLYMTSTNPAIASNTNRPINFIDFRNNDYGAYIDSIFNAGYRVFSRDYLSNNTFLLNTTKHYLEEITTDYLIAIENSQGMSKIAEILNEKIEDILAEHELLTQDDKYRLIYITTLKHSHFYWSTK